MTAASTLRRVAPTALVVGLVAVAAPAQASESPAVEKALAAVKAANDKYQDPQVAVAAGFMPTDDCVMAPEGVMGFHYVNPKLIGAPISELKPPILVYQPDGSGGRKLVAVEYFQPDADQDLTTSGDKPTLFGRAFDGPMEGHTPGMPRHYDEHAWLWQDNPDGTLEPYNPAGSCAGAENIVKVPSSAHGGMAMDTETDAEHDAGQVSRTPSGGAHLGGGAGDSTNQVWLIGLGVAVAAGGLGISSAARTVRRRT